MADSQEMAFSRTDVSVGVRESLVRALLTVFFVVIGAYTR